MLSKEQFSDLQIGFEDDLDDDAADISENEWAMEMPDEDGEISDSSDSI